MAARKPERPEDCFMPVAVRDRDGNPATLMMLLGVNVTGAIAHERISIIPGLYRKIHGSWPNYAYEFLPHGQARIPVGPQ